jgi:hypothetical protein
MSTATSLGLLRPQSAITIPLISSSLTVFYALVEPTILVPFLKAAEEDLAAASKTVRLWWSNYLPAGLITIFAIVLPTVVSGSYALRYFPQDSLRWKLCLAGTTFSAGHFAYGYSVAQVIKTTCDEEVEKQGKTMDTVRRWLQIHVLRTLTTDLPALACFALVAFGPEEWSV